MGCNEVSNAIPESACYSYIKNKDTVLLKIEKSPSVVTGSLVYSLYEKDRNTGEIDGKFRGDTLIANYNFMSEATKSTRRVVFIITDSSATEGYGDPEHADFSSGLKLSRIPCVE